MIFCRRSRNKNRSMINNLKRIMLPILLLLCVLFAMLFYSIYNTRDLAYKYMNDTMTLFVDKVKEDINMINVELLTFLKKNPTVAALPDEIEPTQGKYYVLIANIKESLQGLRIRYKGRYSFYVYNKKADFLILDDRVYFATSKKNEQASNLVGRIKERDYPGNREFEWSYIQTEDRSYLFSYYEHEGKAVGCIVDLDVLFSDFVAANIGYQGIPYYVAENGTILTSSKYVQDSRFEQMLNKGKENSGLINSDMIYRFSLGRAGEIRMLINSSKGILETIVSLQMAIVILFFVILAAAIFTGYIYSQRILMPMKQFVENLQNPDEEQLMNSSETTDILELEMANSQFKKLSREIKSLKIAVYEQELNRKKIELDYMQEQIKPHFYLNCLSIVHAMAERIKAEDIANIVETLANYMRYVIRNSYELRLLRDEVEHVRHYAEIQNLRYPGAFRLEIMMEESFGDYYISPLILQTFVENSFQHALSLEQQIDITLYIDVESFGGEECLYLCLSDTGKGFPEEILLAIRENKPIVYDGREHIGIQNAIKRMKITYGDNIEVKLSNMAENYGAVVEIHLPVQRTALFR